MTSDNGRLVLLAVLGLPADADSQAIKDAYRRLAKELHPDMNPDPDAAQTFLQATDAYEQLTSNKPPPAERTPPNDSQGPAMVARWNIRRRHKPSEYPPWFKPSTRERHSPTGPAAGQRTFCAASVAQFTGALPASVHAHAVRRQGWLGTTLCVGSFVMIAVMGRA